METIIPYIQLSNKFCTNEINNGNSDFLLHVYLTENKIVENKYPSEIGVPLTHSYSEFSLSQPNFSNIKEIYNIYTISKNDLQYSLSVVMNKNISFHKLENLLNKTEYATLIKNLIRISTTPLMTIKTEIPTNTNLIELENGGILTYYKNIFTHRNNQIPINPRFIEIVDGYIKEQ